MILDLQTKFSGSTSAAGVTIGDPITVTAISANVVDLRSAGGSISVGQGGPALADEFINDPEIWLLVQVTDNAFTAAGAATLTITLESDSTANLATAPVVHYSSAVIGKATLVIGYTAVRIQPPSDDYKRFLGLRYTVATGPMTAGNLVAFLTNDVQRNKTYPVGFAVS